MGGSLTFIGAENIVSPLGQTVEENYAQVIAGRSGISKGRYRDRDGNLMPASTFPQEIPIQDLLKTCIEGTLSRVNQEELNSAKSLFILSTTKGDIVQLKKQNLKGASLQHLASEMGALVGADKILTVSQACISGVLSLILAHDLVLAGKYDQVLVAGSDLVSEFVHSGFLSLYAISERPCRPYDKNRSGVTLGEAAASIMISKSSSVFNVQPLEFLGGSSANDSNHISGPSRTGEGLFRCVDKTLNHCDVDRGDIDFINSHGTATSYNDEMESIAFDRLEMTGIPLHSLKGYFGHTLGAAGLVETAISLQSLRTNSIPANLGFSETGTSKPLNIITKSEGKPLKRFLKTASGFGGCNASFIVQHHGN